MASIPQWALDKADALVSDQCPTQSDMWRYRDAFALYISGHEEQPVDPLAAAVRHATDDTWYRTGPDDVARRIRRHLEKNGLTITASDASASVQSPGCVDATSGRKGGQ